MNGLYHALEVKNEVLNTMNRILEAARNQVE